MSSATDERGLTVVTKGKKYREWGSEGAKALSSSSKGR